MPCNVLFLCTGNSARSILAEALLNHLGGGRFRGFSAGSRPAGQVNPHALAALRDAGVPVLGLRSKSWDEFAVAEAPPLDLVVTVCDNAAGEACPVLYGDFLRLHWSLPDPASVAGGDHATREAFVRVREVLAARLAALVALPVAALAREALREALERIATEHPAPQLDPQP